MIALVKAVCSVGFVLGVVAGYILKPLIDSGLAKLFKKNA